MEATERSAIIATKTEHRVNTEIRAPRMRVVDPDGEQVGVLDRKEALYLADQLGLDLVEVAPQANPPVSRLMDYGKWRYEESRRRREQRRKDRQNRVELKEVIVRPNISDHDLARKRGRVEEFLDDGNKVKVTVRLRGRERSRPELATDLLDRLSDQLEVEYAVVAEPAQTGRVISMVLSPAA